MIRFAANVFFPVSSLKQKEKTGSLRIHTLKLPIDREEGFANKKVEKQETP
jgi:hypothetical protein